jgi:lysyl-tRNA synthetase class 2
LTGWPLIVLTIVLTVGVAAAAVLLWSRWRRGRVAVRITGVLLLEVLLVLTAGLIVNRSEQFFPSWKALTGRTRTVTSSSTVSGRLDGVLRAGTVPWRAAALSEWHLAAAPELRVPADYAARPSVAFPVVLDLVGSRTEPPTPDTVAVRALPSARTTASALVALTADLMGDVRVTRGGWAIVAPYRDATLALRLMTADPGRFVALALVGTGKAPATGPAVIVLPTYAKAVRWAVGQTSAPLEPPVVLPPAGPRASTS